MVFTATRKSRARSGQEANIYAKRAGNAVFGEEAANREGRERGEGREGMCLMSRPQGTMRCRRWSTVWQLPVGKYRGMVVAVEFSLVSAFFFRSQANSVIVLPGIQSFRNDLC